MLTNSNIKVKSQIYTYNLFLEKIPRTCFGMGHFISCIFVHQDHLFLTALLTRIHKTMVINISGKVFPKMKSTCINNL